MAVARSYEQTFARENATILQGDYHSTVVVNKAPQTQVNKSKLLFESLAFDGMDARLRNVAKALPNTCTWLFNHNQFRAWADDCQLQTHHGVLWVKGKPGSGKSTIMKESLGWVEKHWPLYTILSYFFNARSSHQLAKSSLGLYRALLHQLLTVHQNDRSLFEKVFRAKVRSNMVAKVRHYTVEEWTETELQNFLITIVTTRKSRPVVIFIDALDEGKDDDVQQIVGFLERLSKHATTSACQLRICLSSRHYPYIKIKDSLSLVVEDQSGHNEDIRTYIRSTLADFEGSQEEELRQRLLKRSAGVFLWVVLVISVLNKAYQRGQKFTTILAKLEEIPSDLHSVFHQILSRDLEDIDKCYMLLEWVSFSMVPLTPVQLYSAMQQCCPAQELDNTTDTITSDEVTRYILHCSRGLVESVEDTDSQHTHEKNLIVQFIHETVRDYVSTLKTTEQQFSGLSTLPFPELDIEPDRCHLKIAVRCVQYLLLMCKHAPLTEKALSRFPLAQYAATYWWQHAQRAEKPPSSEFLETTGELLMGGQGNLLTLVQLYDIRKAFDGVPPLCVIGIDLFDETATRNRRFHGLILFYAILTGLPELVAYVLARDNSIIRSEQSEFNLLLAASYENHERIVQVLLEFGADVNPDGSPALRVALRRGYKGIVRTLLHHGVDVNSDCGSALRVASEIGHSEFVQMLLDHGADIKAYGDSALRVALRSGHRKIVQMLLDHGMDVNADRGSALCIASQYGHCEIVQMLLDRGAVTKGKPEAAKALYFAIERCDKEIVHLLLQHGARVNIGDGYPNYTPLCLAVSHGHATLVEMLLESGADVDARHEKDDLTALHRATSGANADIVQILLKRGANPNARGGQYHWTVLHRAASKNCAEIVQALLEHGGDVNARDKHNETALSLAKRAYHLATIRTLYQHSKDVNCQREAQNTLLRLGVLQGEPKHVEMFLKRGANANQRFESNDFSILHMAAQEGYTEIVQTLLKHGANVNSQFNGLTPLDFALYRNKSRAARVIRKSAGKRGADLETSTEPNHTNPTPMQGTQPSPSVSPLEGDLSDEDVLITARDIKAYLSGLERDVVNDKKMMSEYLGYKPLEKVTSGHRREKLQLLTILGLIALGLAAILLWLLPFIGAALMFWFCSRLWRS